MPIRKVSTFLSGISTFFKKDSAEGAMFTIMSVIKGIKINEQTLFGRKSRYNSVYWLLYVFQLLLVCPCSMIRNPFSVIGSPLGSKLGCGKDVFYDFLNDARTDLAQAHVPHQFAVVDKDQGMQRPQGRGHLPDD